MTMRYLISLGIGVFVVAAAALSYSSHTAAAESGEGSGRPVDDAYAARVLAYMTENGLVGEGRIRSHPFEGSRPHGSI